MRLNIHNLQIKGWNEEEIEQAKVILQRAEEKKHPSLARLEKASYWILFFLIIAGALASAWLIEPILLFATKIQAAIITAVFGLLFGAFASVLVKDLEKLEIHHHILISFIVPVVAIVASIIIVGQVSAAAELLNFSVLHNPYLLGAIYSIFALLPYLIFIIVQRKKHEAR